MIYSTPNGAVEHAGDISSGDIEVSDPAVCDFLDVLYHLIADPNGFGKAEFASSHPTPASTEAA